MKILTQENKQNIINEYLSGKTCTEIAKMYHCQTSNISQILKENNIKQIKNKLRIPSDIQEKICNAYIEEKCLQKELCKRFNLCHTTILKILKEHNVPINSHPPRVSRNVIEDFFENIDTEEKAYLLGFIFADGNVYKNQLSIEIHKKDLEMLQRIKQILHTDTVISQRSNRPTICLRIFSAKMMRDLSNYGIIPNKTQNTTHLPQVDKKYIKDFLRGLVDGDGHITFDKKGHCHIGFVTNYKSTAEDFLNMCKLIIPDISEKIHVTPKDNNYTVEIQNKKNTKQLATVLYKDNNICLSRKYELAKRLFD